jgi:hypothetical protein
LILACFIGVPRERLRYRQPDQNNRRDHDNDGEARKRGPSEGRAWDLTLWI